MPSEKRLIVDALKKYHDAQFTPGVYEHSIFGKAAMLLEADAVEVVHAKWQKQWCDNSMIGHEYEECPICGCLILDTEKFWDCKFCPNCGACMDGRNNVPREDCEV